MSETLKVERTHRQGCPAWSAWDIPGACNCDRPALRQLPLKCEGCGRFVRADDPRARWESEAGEYGQGEYLSRWIVSCASCTPARPEHV